MSPAERLLHRPLPVKLWKDSEPEAFMDDEQKHRLENLRRRNDAIMRGVSGPF